MSALACSRQMNFAKPEHARGQPISTDLHIPSRNYGVNETRSVSVLRPDYDHSMRKMLRIGELARLGKVTPRTVRYYESLGLIPPGEREGEGQHRYPEQTVARLQKIDQLKALGLSLGDIGKVIHLYFEDPTGKRAKIKVLEMLRNHLAETETQLASVAQFRSELLDHIQRFESWLDSHAK